MKYRVMPCCGAELSEIGLGLTIGRNEICARHGYTFNRHDLQNYFNSKSWYQPISQFKLEDVLNSTEYQNMLFIDQYQDEHGLQA